MSSEAKEDSVAWKIWEIVGKAVFRLRGRQWEEDNQIIQEALNGIEAFLSAAREEGRREAGAELLLALKLAEAHVGWGDCSLVNVHDVCRAAILKADSKGTVGSSR